MTHSPSPLETVLLDWLRQDTDIRPECPAPGVLEFNLSAALPDLPVRHDRQGRVILVCNPLLWGAHPGAELIGTDHPIIEYARDHLSRDGHLAVAEAWLPAVSNDANGRLFIPGVILKPYPQTTQVISSWRPVLILTWFARYEADEPAESTIRMVVDATTGQVLPDLLTGNWVDGLRDGRPDGVEKPAIGPVLLAAGQIAEQLVRSDLAAFAQDIEAHLTADIGRIEKHLAEQLGNLRANDTKGRTVLERWAHDEIEDLRKKYKCTGYLRLRSTILAWLPDLTLQVQVAGKIRSVISTEIGWSLIGGSRIPTCARCALPMVFHPCIPGQHLHCACTDEVPCSDCGEPGCTAHLISCGSCRRVFCPDHQGTCSYAKHSAPTCFRCLRPSVDRRPICPECANTCKQCNHLFDATRVALCRGGEIVCISAPIKPCGLKCQECSHIVCSTHGVATAENTRVCTDHAVQSACCNRTWARSRVAVCVVGGEALCPDHRTACASCDSMVCDKHSEPASGRAGKRVCHRCATRCTGCPPNLAWVLADLATCQTCSGAVCQEHAANCVTCQQPHCRAHLLPAHDGALLCEPHRAKCAHCPPSDNLHRAPLQICVICNDGVCAAHDHLCGTCGIQHYGATHTLPACAYCGRISCGTLGCSHKDALCDGCKLSYCRHCGSAMGRSGQHTGQYATKGKFCPTCVALVPQVVSPNLISWLQHVQSRLGQGEQGLLMQILAQSKHLKVYRARQRGGDVFALRAMRPWYKPWKTDLSGNVLWLRIDVSNTVNGHIARWEKKA